MANENKEELNADETKAEQCVADQLLSKQKEISKMSTKEILAQIEQEKKQIEAHLARAKELESEASYVMALSLIKKENSQS